MRNRMQIYFAPLESITGYVFRNVYEEYYGGIDRYFTPFITATDSRRLRNKEMRDILPENNQVGCLIPQIMSNRAEEFLRVADQMAELGYDKAEVYALMRRLYDGTRLIQNITD